MCFKAFTITAEVPEIFMHQFWYTIKKLKELESYEFFLANKKCIVDAEVFRKILDICPRVEGKEFTEVQDDDATLTFLIDLGYKGPLHKYNNMYVDHMHRPWRTLVAIINKCLSRKTASNDILRNPELTYCGAYDGIVSRLKFVRTGEDYQEYGLPIPDMMLNDSIKQLESYQMFIKYSTGHIPPKKSRGKGSQGKKTGDVSQESVDVFEESKPEPAKKKTGSRSTRGVVIQDPPSAPKPKPAASKLKIKGTGRTLGVLDESTVVSATSSEGIGTKPVVLDEENVISEANVILEWGSKNESEHFDDSQLNFDVKEKKDNDGDAEDEGGHHISDIQDTDDKDAETESESDEIYKYKIYMRKDVDGDAELAGNIMTSDNQVKVSTEFPLPSFSLSVSSGFGTQFLYSSSDISLTVIPKTTDLPPIPEILIETPVSTAISPPHVTPTISIVEQPTTPIPTPPIIIDALTITTTVPESNALTNVQLRVVKLEKDVSAEALATLKSQVPMVVEHYLGSKNGDDLQRFYRDTLET
ncbi:hypothetical protein Tco_0270200 [Tanacetum coccineum]